MNVLEIILGVLALVLLIVWIVVFWLWGVKDIEKAECVVVLTTVLMIVLGIGKAIELVVEGLLGVIK